MNITQYRASFNPDNAARALPLESYSSSEIYDHELANVFERDWVFVATTSELTAPGDHKPVRVGHQPVLLWRGKDGDLRAMANLCAHRGMLLVEVPGNQDRIVCPYHAWAYGDSGKLLGAPHAKGVDRDSHCLPLYPVVDWNGMVFVSLDRSVVPFDAKTASVDKEVDHLNPNNLTPWSIFETQQEWEANWKIIYANAVESYHLFQVHPETLEPFTPTKGARTVDSSGDAIVTAGTMRASKKSESTGEYRLIGFPPYLVCVFDGSGIYWQSVHPLGPSRSVVRNGAILPGEQPNSAIGKFSAKTFGAFWFGMAGDFLPEDKDICERAQRAASGSFSPGQLVELEEPVTHFHSYLAKKITDPENKAH